MPAGATASKRRDGPCRRGRTRLVAATAEVLESNSQVLWAFGFAGLGASCGAREVTPSSPRRECTLTMRSDRQPVATHDNGFRLFQPFRGRPICHRFPAIATALLHKGSILCSPWRQRRAGCSRTSISSLAREGLDADQFANGSGEKTLVQSTSPSGRCSMARSREERSPTGAAGERC